MWEYVFITQDFFFIISNCYFGEKKENTWYYYYFFYLKDKVITGVNLQNRVQNGFSSEWEHFNVFPQVCKW